MLSFHILLTARLGSKQAESFHRVQRIQVASGYSRTEKFQNRRWAFIPPLTNFPHLPWLQKWIAPPWISLLTAWYAWRNPRRLGGFIYTGQQIAEAMKLPMTMIDCQGKTSNHSSEFANNYHISQFNLYLQNITQSRHTITSQQWANIPNQIDST